jgi:hypothetical protein
MGQRRSALSSKKNMKTLRCLVMAATAMAALNATAANPKSYQLVGQIVSISDNTIVVQKGDSKYELSRKTKTKGADKVKVGDSVTVTYHMVAEKVDSKDAAAKGDK